MTETKEPEQSGDDAALRTDADAGAIGDVETAGETTAAAAIHGPVNQSPVGADTLADIKISDAPKSDERKTD